MTHEYALPCPACGTEVVVTIDYRGHAGHGGSWTEPPEGRYADDVSVQPAICECSRVVTLTDREAQRLADVAWTDVQEDP